MAQPSEAALVAIESVPFDAKQQADDSLENEALAFLDIAHAPQGYRTTAFYHGRTGVRGFGLASD
jgi:hypothetical protein